MLLCLSLAGPGLAGGQTNPPVEVEPNIYASQLASSVHVEHPNSLEYWQEKAQLGDWGAMLDSQISWDEATGLGIVSWVGIFPTNNSPLSFQTNAYTGTYQRHTNPIRWTYTGPVMEHINLVYVTNCPWSTPSWYSQETWKRQVAHVETETFDLQDNTTVALVRTKTNNAKIKLYTGIAIDSTRPHLFRLNVQVWNTTAPTTATLIPPSAVRLLSQTPNGDNDIFIVRADDLRQDVTPTLVGVSDSDIKFQVTPEKLKIRFYAQAGKMADGYDPRPSTKQDHWTSIVLGGTNEVTELRIPADWATNRIELKVNGPISVSQTDNFSAQITPLTIVSSGTATPASIEARDKITGTTLALLNVRVLPLRTVPVGIYRIEDWNSGGGDTFLGSTSSNGEIVGQLNSVFKQAAIQFTDATVATLSQVLDNRYDVCPEDGKFGINAEETQAIRNVLQPLPRQIRIVIAKDTTLSYGSPTPTELNKPKGTRHESVPSAPLKFLVIWSSPAAGMLGAVAAHEVGHYWELPDHYDQVNAGVLTPSPSPTDPAEDHLMIDGAPFYRSLLGPEVNPIPVDPNAWLTRSPGRWMRKEDWDQANSEAANSP